MLRSIQLFVVVALLAGGAWCMASDGDFGFTLSDLNTGKSESMYGKNPVDLWRKLDSRYNIDYPRDPSGHREDPLFYWLGRTPGDNLTGSLSLWGNTLHSTLTNTRTSTTFVYNFTDKNGKEIRRTFVVNDNESSPPMAPSQPSQPTGPTFFRAGASSTAWLFGPKSRMEYLGDVVGKDWWDHGSGQDDLEAFLTSARSVQGGALAAQFVNSSVSQTITQTLLSDESGLFFPVDVTEKAGAAGSSLNLGVGAFSYKNFHLKASNDTDIDGETYRIPLAYMRKLNDRVSLRFTMPMEKTRTNGGDMWRLGGEIAVPIIAMGVAPNADMRWTVTPLVGETFEGSTDYFHAGFVLDAGVANRLDKRFGDFIFTYGNYLGYYKSIPVEISLSEDFNNFIWNYGVNQAVFTNVARGGYFFLNDWMASAQLSDTRFLINKTKQQTNYQSVGADLSRRAFDGRAIFRVGAGYDRGDRSYSAYNVNFSCAVRF